MKFTAKETKKKKVFPISNAIQTSNKYFSKLFFPLGLRQFRLLTFFQLLTCHTRKNSLAVLPGPNTDFIRHKRLREHFKRDFHSIRVLESKPCNVLYPLLQNCFASTTSACFNIIKKCPLYHSILLSLKHLCLVLSRIFFLIYCINAYLYSMLHIHFY